MFVLFSERFHWTPEQIGNLTLTQVVNYLDVMYEQAEEQKKAMDDGKKGAKSSGGSWSKSMSSAKGKRTSTVSKQVAMNDLGNMSRDDIRKRFSGFEVR